MIDRRLLDILVCPETHTALAPADQNLLARLNEAIGTGQVKNRLGQPVRSPLQQGLVREDRRLLFPLVDGIPVMILDEAIPLDQITAGDEERATGAE